MTRYLQTITHALLALLLLTGCASLHLRTPSQDIANIPVPQDWLFAVAKAQAASEQQWWRAYGNAELNQLMTRAFAHNHNLRGAAFNLQKARLTAIQNAHNRTPQLDGNLSASASRNFNEARNTRSMGSGLSTSYQIDLWGKLDIAQDMAQWTAEASNEDLLAAQLSLSADLVRAYINLAWLDEQIRFSERNLAHNRDNLSRTRARYQLGNVAQMDVTRSEQTLAQLETNARALQKSRAEQLMQLSLLLGEPPQLLEIHPPALDTFIVPAHNLPLPAALLRQRPDLRAAQYRLQQQLGDLLIAERAFYPEINLNGGISAGGARISELFTNPMGNLSLSISLPFLRMRHLQLAKKQNELNYQQALSSFEQTLYNAIRDVNLALLNQRHQAAEAETLAAQLRRARTLSAQTRDRYELGADSLQTLLDSEQSQREAEQALLANRHAQLSASVDLALALGGSAEEK